MITALLGKYGRLSKEVKEYIAERQSIIPEEEQDSIVQKILRECKKAPDLSYIQNLLQGYEPKKKTKPYYWLVCLECGTEYGGYMTMCPTCFSNGLLCKDRAVKTSEEKPDLRKVIRYNKLCEPQNGYKSCYDCNQRYMSYCPDFGNPTNCNYDEQKSCKCFSCCQYEYNKNTELEEKRSNNENEIKYKYAIPLAQARSYTRVASLRSLQQRG